MRKSILFLLVVCCLLFVAFSYGFVDTNFPLKTPDFLCHLVRGQRPLTTMIYIIVVTLLFGVYGYVLKQAKKKKLNAKQIWGLIFTIVIILFFSFPAFSYDIFNYMATAKVTFFYKENPYLVMPIEFVGEPMLKFMHAANKTALYGPTWILLTFFPHFLGRGNILLTVFSFKSFIALFYLGLSWLIWKVSQKNLYSLTFFALNPLVIIETLVSTHNDVVMMFWAFLAIWLLFQKRKILSFLSLLLSTGVKFATVVLWPLWFFASRLKREKLIALAVWLLFLVFLLSPLREEIYPWYFIWIISLVALVPHKRLLYLLVLSFSFGLLMRYTPYFYTRRWDGITPIAKTLTTFIPPVATLIWFLFKNQTTQLLQKETDRP